MLRSVRIAILALSLLIAASAAALVYINSLAFPEGPTRAICTPTRLGNYLFEAYVIPATPRVGEEFQITASIQGSSTISTPINFTLILLKPGRISIVEGPEAAPLGIKTWSYRLAEAGFYNVYFIVSGPEGSGRIEGSLQIVSVNEAETYSLIRILSYISLWIGIPLLIAMIIFSKMREGE
ncbi:MAG: hypothetical protein QXM16_07445 [Nitrososphaerota archaeon]